MTVPGLLDDSIAFPEIGKLFTDAGRKGVRFIFRPRPRTGETAQEARKMNLTPFLMRLSPGMGGGTMGAGAR